MPEIKFFPETHVAYVAEVGPYSEAIGRGFRRLARWSKSSGRSNIGQRFGIFYDDPTKVAAENLRCDLCVKVGPHVNSQGEIRTKEIGGWRVATITFEGNDHERPAYEEVYRWLREEGYHEADVPVVKYGNQLGKRMHAEIAVPVIEKKRLPGSRKSATGAAERKGGAKASRTAGAKSSAPKKRKKTTASQK